MSVCCQHSDSHSEVEWARRALQCLLVSALHHGEIKHLSHAFKPNRKTDKSESVGDQPPLGKTADGSKEENTEDGGKPVEAGT